MNRIEIEVMDPGAALKSVADTWRRAAAGKKVGPRIAFGSLRELFSALTERRLELLRHVSAHEGLNTRRLAQALKRDYKNVHTDVAELVALGLLEKGAGGRLSTPFDEIVIHAGLRRAA